MKFDRSTIIGFVVLAALFFGYFYFNNREQATYLKEKERTDSIAAANRPKPDTLAFRQDSMRADSNNRIIRSGSFQSAINGREELAYIENDLFRIAFTTKGGQPKWIELKKYKNMDSGFVKLLNTPNDKISYII